MSRVFRALERAEEEKKQRVREEPALKVFDEKSGSGKEAPGLKFPVEKAMKVEEPDLTPREEAPVLTIPANSVAEEEFRKLKTQIFLRLPNPPHSILVTSTAPEEGKTTVAVNLAVAISREINRRAILIDGDMRKPRIYLGRSQDAKGLSNFLSDGTPLSEILINSELEHLRIILAGPSTQRPSELIGSKRMAELMKSLSEVAENTYIVIDSPPIIPTTEPILLSKIVDGIILVVRADRMPRESIQRAVKSIDRQKIIGVVFNEVELKPSSYYSKHYYGYYKK